MVEELSNMKNPIDIRPNSTMLKMFNLIKLAISRHALCEHNQLSMKTKHVPELSLVL
jgi:hypothetical protein